MFFHGVDPDVDKAVHLADRVLPQSHLLLLLFHPLELLAPLAQVLVVGAELGLDWLAVVVHALPGLAVIEPAVEGALHALAVDHLAAHSQVRPQMLAVGFQHEGFAVGGVAEGHHVLAGHVDGDGLALLEFIGVHHHVPPIGERGEGSSFIFKFLIIIE